jgi:ribokinase
MQQTHAPTPGPPAGVVVIGSLTVDLTAVSGRLPRLGETVLGTDFQMVPGGKGANQALVAARLGAPTWMVGAVGDDLFRQTVLDGLAGAGVNAEHVRTVAATPTGIAHIRVDSTGDNDIVMIPLANAALSTTDIERALAALAGQVGVALVQLEIPIDIAVYAIRAAHSSGLQVILDPAPAAPLPDAIYALVDVVTPNESEAALLTGVDVVDSRSAATAGRWFIERGCGTAVITLGAKGAVVVGGDGSSRHYPGFPVKAVDATAAGDAFSGALGTMLAAGAETETALTWAAAAGALAVTAYGASSSLPDRRAVEAFLASCPVRPAAGMPA